MYRTNLRSSPTLPGTSTRLGTRETTDRTTPTTVIVTTLLDDLGFVTCNHNHHRHYLTHPVRGPDIHRENPSTVDTTITISLVRVRVLAPFSQVHVRSHRLIRPIRGPGPNTRYRTLLTLRSDSNEQDSGGRPHTSAIGITRLFHTRGPESVS